jgi:glycosyltransferase involved in cell wall biosynthesis
MLAAMRRSGIRVTTVVLRDRRDARRVRQLRAPLVLVDTIAASLAAPHLARLRERDVEVVTLAHMPTGALTLARRSDRVIAVSRALADELVRGGIDRRRIVVVWPGRERIAASHATAARAMRGATATRDRDGTGARPQFRVLCVANWTAVKGLHTLVAAVARVPDVTLDLVGDMPDRAYADRVRRAIARRGLAARVRIHGSLGRAALARRYAAADVFALPSIREGYGIAFAEALAHGLPVVACDIAAVREVTGRAAILVPPGRVGPLADALRRLVDDERARRAFARRSLGRARELPTWAESEEQFVAALGFDDLRAMAARAGQATVSREEGRV